MTKNLFTATILFPSLWYSKHYVAAECDPGNRMFRTFFKAYLKTTAIVAASLSMIASSPTPCGAADAEEAFALLNLAENYLNMGDAEAAVTELKRIVYFHKGRPPAAKAQMLLKKIQADPETGRRGDESDPDPTKAASKLVQFYQNHLRTFKDPKSSCPSYPNCSRYAIQAIEKHGSLLGVFIFVDRFWREATTAGEPPFVTENGKRLHYDPLHMNDYWLNTPENE